MHRGYVKLWRKSIDGGWLTNPNLWCFWCYCLIKATHKPCKVLIGFKEVLLEPGQFVFGRKKCQKDLRLTEQTVRTCLQTLKSTGNITTKSTNRFTIITIMNWGIYQPDKDQTNHPTNQQSNQQLTNNYPTTNHIQTQRRMKKNEGEEIKGELPEWIDSEIWKAFIELRQKMKAPITARAAKNIISELTKLRDEGQDPNAVLDQSITRGWRGVFPIRSSNGSDQPGFDKSQPDGLRK